MSQSSAYEGAASTTYWTASGASSSHPDRAAFLSAAEERRLFHALWSRSRSSRAARNARARLIVAHLPLVVSVAEQRVTRRDSLPDLVQEGNIALVNAVDRYHPEAKTRFAAFARVMIWRTVKRAAIGRASPPVSVVVSDWGAHDEGEVKDQVGELLQNLTVEEALVVRHRFGIGVTERRTLSQVAGLFGWGTYRVNRLNAQAMTKLRQAEE